MNSLICIEIEQNWLAIAQKFAAEQSEIAQQQQIFCNTLVVCGLHRYLGWGEVESCLEESYSWHPQTRVLTGWSDLSLPDYGRVMAFPVQQATSITLPEILPLGCVGGVVIEINQNLTHLNFRGFISEQRLYSSEKVILMTELEPVDQLFDALFLRAEERLIVTHEIESYLQGNDELQPYLQDFLTEEGLTDLINRLNYLYYHQGQELEILVLGDIAESSDMLMIRESTSEYAPLKQVDDSLILGFSEDDFDFSGVQMAPLHDDDDLTEDLADFYEQVVDNIVQNLLGKITELRNDF